MALNMGLAFWLVLFIHMQLEVVTYVDEMADITKHAKPSFPISFLFRAFAKQCTTRKAHILRSDPLV